MTYQPRLQPGDFVIKTVRTLGQGGFGVVDEVVVTHSFASHPTGTRLACKRLNAKFARHHQAQERFEREIRAVRDLQHPSIVAYRGENVAGDARFYVMDIYPGSLREWCERGQRLSYQAAAKLGADIADAMAHAHAEGYYHRDLKPENVLLSGDGTPVVSDWGLGYFMHKGSKVLRLTQAGLGTAYYCSLHQWSTGKGGAQDDIYSLGMVLDEVVRGAQRQLAYVGAGVTSDSVGSPPTLGAELFNAMTKEMTGSPHQRPQSMTEVQARLEEITWC